MCEQFTYVVSILTFVTSYTQHVPDVKWVDGGKPLFHVNFSLVSSIYTSQTHLHNFFDACDRFRNKKITDEDLTRHVKVSRTTTAAVHFAFSS